MSRVSYWMVLSGLSLSVWMENSTRAEEAKDFQIAASLLDLPEKNVRTAEPAQPRAYPAKKDGKTPDRLKKPSWLGSPEDPNGSACPSFPASVLPTINAQTS